MNDRGYPRLEVSENMSNKSTTTLNKNKKPNYGTMTDRDPSEESSPQQNSPVEEFYEDDDISPEMKIDSALNQIKTYRLFFFIGIIPMILSFAFSDLIVDSLNFLELMPMGLECQTSMLNSEGETKWVACSINRICNQKHGDNIVRDENGVALSRKAQDDYYSLHNWVEDMEIQ